MSSELARLIIQKYLNEYFLNLNSDTLSLSVIIFINLIKNILDLVRLFKLFKFKNKSKSIKFSFNFTN